MRKQTKVVAVASAAALLAIGAMATDKLVEDDDNIYYVDSNGVMVTNTWVKVVTRIRTMRTAECCMAG